jgi:hypothetical protein
MNDGSHTTPLKPAPVIASPSVTHTGPAGDVTVIAIRDKAVNRYKRKGAPTPPEPPLTPANPYKKRSTIASVPPITPLNPYKKRAGNDLPFATPLNPYKKRFIPATSMNEAAQSLLDFHDSGETPLKRPTSPLLPQVLTYLWLGHLRRVGHVCVKCYWISGHPCLIIVAVAPICPPMSLPPL